MGMNVGSSGESDEPMMDVNTTPLIDVMLVLIVMFIITLPVMTHAVKLDMPSGNPPPVQKDPIVIEVEIDYDGSVLWNGTQVADFGTLERYFKTEGAKPEQAELHIRPNRRAKYDSVAKVLALAQRNGMTKIGFVGNEQFM
jgi:biopolymer transport protein ExbD